MALSRQSMGCAAVWKATYLNRSLFDTNLDGISWITTGGSLSRSVGRIRLELQTRSKAKDKLEGVWRGMWHDDKIAGSMTWFF